MQKGDNEEREEDGAAVKRYVAKGKRKEHQEGRDGIMK